MVRTEHSDDKSKKDASVTADAETREALDDPVYDASTCRSSVVDVELIADQADDEKIHFIVEGATVSSVFAFSNYGDFGNAGANADESLETDVEPNSNQHIQGVKHIDRDGTTSEELRFERDANKHFPKKTLFGFERLLIELFLTVLIITCLL